MYDTLDEVPWNSVTAVTGPSGSAVTINHDGFAVWLDGPREGQRIPLDAGGPWAVNCKHCWARIEITAASSDWLHAEGAQTGKHTCAVDPYGFHAEPVGVPCGGHPANPCNGARGLTPAGEQPQEES